MLVLISPAKKQDFTNKQERLPYTQPLFKKDANELVAVLAAMDEEKLGKLMKISPKLAKLNVDRFNSFKKTHNQSNSIQAALAFQGDTYVGLEAKTMSDAEWEFATDHLAILSGLYGFLRPLDLIQPHRLEMGTGLDNSRGKDIYSFWGDGPTKQINKNTKGHTVPWVINLASQEYFKVVRQELLKAPVLTPVFKEKSQGKLKVIGIKAKRARGMMARYIITNRIQEPESLKYFTMGGYQFNNDLSNEKELVFVAG
ncbi:MAG: peroxide stress protein YaaA [Magnetococcales bacterium]|nr:peroxide stress protein YaaA [Magnetococcales bacterium]